MATQPWYSQILPAITSAGAGVANAVNSNPVGHFLYGSAINTANDIGTGLGAMTTPGQQQSSDASLKLAQQAMQKAKTTTDPAEKQRLLTVAGQATQTNASNAQAMSQGYSPDVAQNPLLRGAQTGMQIGTGADMLAHPIGTLKGAIDLTKGALTAVRHPIQTLQTASDTLSNLPKITGDFVNSAIHDPNNFQLTGSEGLKKLGARWLLGQYKNAEDVSRDPLGVVTALKQYGLSDPQDISDAAKVVTGAPDTADPAQAIVHKKVLQAIGDSDPVDVGGIKPLAQQVMDSSTNVTGAVEKKAVATVEKGLDNLPGATKINSLGETLADPQSVFEFSRKLDTLSSTANSAAFDKEGNLVNPTQLELSKYYSSVSQELKTRLFTGATSSGVGTRIGADNLDLSSSWTPEEISTLKKVGNGQLADDVISQTTVGGLRKIESLFTQGSRMANSVINAGEKSPSLTQMASGLAASLHPNPIGMGVFAATTNAGKEALGNSLYGLGEAGVGAPSATLKGSIAAQALLPVITNKNEQNQKQNTPNQNFSTPPSISNATSISPVVNTIPQSQDQINFDQNGHVGVFNPFNGTDAITKAQYQDTLKQKQAVLKQYTTQEGQDALNPTALAQDKANAANVQTDIDTLNSLSAKSRSLDQPYQTALTLSSSVNQATDDIKNGWSNISLVNGDLNKLATINNGAYSKLAQALKYLQDKSGVQIFEPGMSLDVALGNLQQAAQTLLYSNYYSQFPSQGGYSQALPTIGAGGNSTQSDNAVNMATGNTQLPPIAPQAGQNAGIGVGHPFVY
jgi:hypothetical protein